uniref:C2H2-type domain-containing protein n=1 Tax=Plectus sambesii TaxID=2011161 RepID=A0A914VU96_9BILA
MNQLAASVEGYDARTMGFFDDDGNYWEPEACSSAADSEEIPNQFARDRRYTMEENAFASRTHLDSFGSTSRLSSSASSRQQTYQSWRRTGLLDSHEPARRPTEASDPRNGQFSVMNPENSRMSSRTLLAPPLGVNRGGRLSEDGNLYGHFAQRPYGALPREPLLDDSGNFNVASAIRIFGSQPPKGFSMESYQRPVNAAGSDSAPMQNRLNSNLFACTSERPPLLSVAQHELAGERGILPKEIAQFDVIEGEPFFNQTFDLSYSLAVFDKAYENALWDYDPKYTWDYLPATKRGTMCEAMDFTVNKDYVEEEFEWKKFAVVREKHWREDFIPKVLEEKRLRDAGLLPDKKPNQTSDEAICDFMLEKLTWTDDTCVVEYCSICDVEFRAVMPSIQHYESSSHDRAVKHFIVNEMLAYQQVTPEQLRTPWLEIMLNRIIKKIKVKPEIWYCNACNVAISSMLTAQQHLKGTSHRRKLNGLPPVQKLPFHLRNQYQDVCVLCSVTLCDETAIEAHITSGHHIAAVRAAARSNTPVPPGPSGWIRDQHSSGEGELGFFGNRVPHGSALSGYGPGINGAVSGYGPGITGAVSGYGPGITGATSGYGPGITGATSGYGPGINGAGPPIGPVYHPFTSPPTSFSQGGATHMQLGDATHPSYFAHYSSPHQTAFQPPPPPPQSRLEQMRQIKNEFACELCKKTFVDEPQLKLHFDSFQHHLRATQMAKTDRTASASRGRGGARPSPKLPGLLEYDYPNRTVPSVGFVPHRPLNKYPEFS